MTSSDDRLTGTRYDWLRNPAKMEPEERRAFERDWHGGVRVSVRATGAQAFPVVAWLGGEKPTETNDRRSRDAETTFENISLI
jgi:hypothetical protein